MIITPEKKKEIINKYGTHAKDSGRAEVQVAIYTHRINELTQHMQTQPKDMSTQRALINLVGKRRSILDFLQRKDISRYRSIISELNIRK